MTIKEFVKKNYTLVAIFTIVIAASSFMAGHSIGYWNGYAEKINWVNQEEEMARDRFIAALEKEAEKGYDFVDVEFLGGRLADGTGIVRVWYYNTNDPDIQDVLWDVVYTDVDANARCVGDEFIEGWCAEELAEIYYTVKQ